MKIKFLFALLITLMSVSALATESVTEVASVVTTAATPEDQIPLKIESSDKAGEKKASGQKVIFTLGIILTLVGVGYYLVRRYAHKSQPGKSNMQIKVLSQHYLGPKKSLAIVRVAGESILIGVTDQNISMIKALSLLDEELPQVLPKNFSETMSEEQAAEALESDEFSFEGIKTVVSGKIKSMRNIQQ